MPSAPRLTRPEELESDAWALFEACALGNMPKVKAALAKDPRLVNAQYWYRFPIHMAAFAGNAEIVALLLAKGADPGQSIYTYDSWDRLLLGARERGYDQIESMLQRAMRRRFRYATDFGGLAQAEDNNGVRHEWHEDKRKT